MKERGYFLTILSAIIFGFTPILAKFTYNMGNNGITLAFLGIYLSYRYYL